MRLRRLCTLALTLLCLGATCSQDSPRLLPPGTPEPPFDYALYSDARGHFLGQDSAALLVQRPSHRERVFADAQRGDVRAQELFLELEDVFLLGGWHVAEHVTQPRCLLTPFLPSCRLDWSFLDKLLRTPGSGALHLRLAAAQSFALHARERGLRNALVLSCLNALLAGTIVHASLSKAAAAEATAFSTGTSAAAAASSEELLASLEPSSSPLLALSEAEALEARLLPWSRGPFP